MKTKNKKKTKLLVTHNGSFHSDDVFACATLSLLLEKKGEKFKVIRTRDEKIIKTGDYVFDVGGIYNPRKNKFDHHQVSFKEKRKNGIVYSSFGLIWKKYGIEICGSKSVAERIDLSLVQAVDAGDNGIEIYRSIKKDCGPYKIQNIFGLFLPTALEKLDKDKQFIKVFRLARIILTREIKKNSDSLKMEKTIQDLYKKSKNKKLLIIENNIYPRHEIQQAVENFPQILYVVFPSTNDWNILAIKKDLNSFKLKKQFPKKWGGLIGAKFQKVSKVADAIFCHRGLFLAVAKSKEGAKKLAELALKSRT